MTPFKKSSPTKYQNYTVEEIKDLDLESKSELPGRKSDIPKISVSPPIEDSRPVSRVSKGFKLEEVITKE